MYSVQCRANIFEDTMSVCPEAEPVPLLRERVSVPRVTTLQDPCWLALGGLLPGGYGDMPATISLTPLSLPAMVCGELGEREGGREREGYGGC